MVGKTLSHYEILDELGRGGMGVVYRARDTRLDRIVALKVLPKEALASEEDRARFFREAKAAAQLSHAHIASIFDSDEAVPAGADSEGARPFIAMEFVDGDSLADRVSAGPLPLSDVLRIGTEMAHALEAAHEKGIVHRDVKPQNVMLTARGDVKVLDFGLAKTAASTLLTRQGSTLGTIAYMSPEQARGEEVDRRTDLWSLGVVLYEMLTGRLPFARDYEQATVYSILNEAPEPVTALRTGVPLEIEHIVEKALAKDIELRYQTAADCIADLKGAALRRGSGVHRASAVAGAASSVDGARMGAGSAMPRWGWGVVLAAMVVSIGGTWLLAGRGSEPAPKTLRLGLRVMDRDLPPATLTVSPSTTYLAWSDRRRLFVRDLRTAETWEIPEAEGVNRIVFTPDENWLILEKPGMILRSRIRDGRPFEVTAVAAGFTTANVTADGDLVYEGGGRIWRIGPAGGAPEPAIEMDSTIFYNEPRFAPDGSTLLVDLDRRGTGARSIGVFDYSSGRLRGELPLVAPYHRMLDTGHLVFLGAEGELQTVPTDLSEPRLLGPVVPLGPRTARGAWSVTDAGHLFYAPVRVEGGVSGFSARFFRSVRWDGTETELPPPRTFYEDVHLDPSGRRAAVMITEGQRDVWVVDLYSGFRTRITAGSVGSDPSWHPSADSILFVVRRAGEDAELVTRAADGSGEPRSLYATEARRVEEPHWSPDARHVLFSAETGGATGLDVWRLDVESGEAQPVIGGRGDQTNASHSPDGRFVAYDAQAEDGSTGVWLVSTRFAGLPLKVSQAAGADPRWAPDGQALYYTSGNDMMRVAVDAGVDPPWIGEPEVVRSFLSPFRMWDLLPDGTGMIQVTDVAVDTEQIRWADSSGVQVHVILNWVEELKELVPIR